MASWQVEGRGPRRYEVRVNGPLPSGWAGRLSASLAVAGSSILSGRASRVARGWEGAFDVQVLEGGEDPSRLDLDAMVRVDPPAGPRGTAVPGLLYHRVHRAPGHLDVEVVARDEVGLLHGILRVFGFYALFPGELALRTEGGRAMDTFRLLTMGGQAPSAEAAAAVDARLLALREPGAEGALPG